MLFFNFQYLIIPFNEIVFCIFFIVCYIHANSCKNKKESTKAYSSATVFENFGQPDFNFIVRVSKGWMMYGTVLQGLRVRILNNNPRLHTRESALVNIIIVSMEGKRIDTFVKENSEYLVEHMEGVDLITQGSIPVSNTNSKWVTYSKEQAGVRRDMINYVIHINGNTYMITCGTKAGTMGKYRRLSMELQGHSGYKRRIYLKRLIIYCFIFFAHYFAVKTKR